MTDRRRQLACRRSPVRPALVRLLS